MRKAFASQLTNEIAPDEHAAPALKPLRQRSPRAAAELKPPLKWAGGKRWLVPHLEPLWRGHSHRRLVEPFCGGLAVVLGLNPERALLNDINPHAINFYQWLQNGMTIGIVMRNEETLFYKHRESFNRLIIAKEGTSSQKAAEYFYYLNRTGFNGLCRFNRSGEFNVPFGRYNTINYQRNFSEYKPLFRGWIFQNVDFEELTVDPEDFFYADPPYDVQFRQYAQEGFAWADQERLAQWLAKHPGPVVASNQATERVLQLYGDLGFHIILLDAPRRISCTGDRTPAKEMLATKGISP